MNAKGRDLLMSNQSSKEESRRFQPKPNTCGLFDNTRNDRSDLS
jgi:hypothetical protein